MKTRKRIRKFFPLDFYGADRGWRFVIRAYNTSEVFDALMWRSYLSVRRQDFNLLRLAVETFSYVSDYSEGHVAEISGSHGTLMRVKMLGPVVEVGALNKAYLEKKRINADCCPVG
ncbi:hypothetical protein A1OO_12340 [Enterovibrio norvegicus FF-33]|uniref:Uncharacterized protein n=1 Tax=Enterovibrio norvegicus FF-454 TaxID=1185651 RepID=A0A1E5C8D6_9GAMM|nr:hypothetical protein [Enterovibrio norvegicus]OEE61760.1 hypothetical protein A1OK_08355 [Enterovibrio norvegicus FF-454]OEE66557.1 hypothetical protein A1OO_12340 [Enterovibrio norvegicus FF-33]OEE75437.1 hypothetical protein A1OQ_22775 [Enterovibrio norvegicus FF-162]